MPKSKTILHYSVFLLILFLFLLIRISTMERNSILKMTDTEFTGRVNLFEKHENYTKIGITINGENLSGNLYNRDINLNYNDLIKITGNLKNTQENNNFYSFSYKDYLKRHNQFFIVRINEIELLEENTNLFYRIKNLIVRRINSFNTNYLHAFLLGDTSYIDNNILENYQTLGISHLFAVSGMHLTFFIGFINRILSNIEKRLKFVITSLFLLLYSFLVGFTPSILRASLLYIFNSIIKKPLISLMIAFMLILLINPYNFFEIGFELSFLMSFILIIFSKKIKQFSNIKQLIILSLITFIASIPLLILNFNQINIITPFYNLLYIPYVSYVIFPLSFIVFILPNISKLYLVFIEILEKTVDFFTKLDIVIWIMREPNILGFILLIIFIIITLYFVHKGKYIIIPLLVTFLLFYRGINFFLSEKYITILNVGQGDSAILYSNNHTTLVDTGGNFYTDTSKSIIIPYLKAKGISKIDEVILTHGDFDHIGGAINLVNSFKVEKVIFNCGEFNDLEKDLIKVLDKKKIPYYSCIKALNIDKYKLYFLNNKLYDNENDNSSVIYTKLNNYKFLFMGDAGEGVEEDLIERYNLNNIDVLKVGHHGSKTSSSKEFINEINPKHSVISVGKNNRYGHPNKEVLDNLNKSKIYRTDKQGSIIFKIKDNKLKVETCAP